MYCVCVAATGILSVTGQMKVGAITGNSGTIFSASS